MADFLTTAASVEAIATSMNINPLESSRACCLSTANLTAFEQNQFYDQVMFSLNSFRNNFHFGLIFFSIHLLLLGYLVF